MQEPLGSFVLGNALVFTPVRKGPDPNLPDFKIQSGFKIQSIFG
jgi:hypothetical protein